MDKVKIYRSFSQAMMEKYGEKVYKIPISISSDCPNRDGTLGTGGCSFCGESGAGHETLSMEMPIPEQFARNADYIQKRYKAKKFIPYFQDFTNTYMTQEDFRGAIRAITDPRVVGVAISTRPDCIDVTVLEELNQISKERGWDVYLELGLQSVNYKTLNKINRGHTLAEFIDAVEMIRPYGFDVCAHMILNLPWDTMEDAVEGAKILSALRVNGVKLHGLYIEENTQLAQSYKKGEWSMISLEEYVDRVVAFLCHLSPEISVHRLVGRAPKEGTLFVNWDRSWWVIRDRIEENMTGENLYQGIYFDYLGGKALGRFR